MVGGETRAVLPKRKHSRDMWEESFIKADVARDKKDIQDRHRKLIKHDSEKSLS